jgi:hypothetical protein
MGEAAGTHPKNEAELFTLASTHLIECKPKDAIHGNPNSEEHCPESECDSRSSGFLSIPEVPKKLRDTLGSENKASGKSKQYDH